MTLRALQVSGYRSVRSLFLRLGRINVVLGPNGSGKTNLYRALYLFHAAARGEFARTLAEEGGIASVLWAGPRGKGPVRLEVSVELDEFSYRLSCGIIPPTPSAATAFNLDPHVKEERLHLIDGRKRTELMKRADSAVSARDQDGDRVTFPFLLPESESVYAELREPHRFPVLSALRQELLAWRFYHGFRTDLDSPLREPQVGVRTPILSHDGRDLAAALQTIREIGDAPGLEQAIDHAFPGARLGIEGGSLAAEGDRRFRLSLQMPEFQRPFEARELSDGTLHYLALLAALLSPRPPAFLALNEPEASIHPNLLEPLARLIVRAGRDTQLWITTHSQILAAHIETLSGHAPIQLEKRDGETRLASEA